MSPPRERQPPYLVPGGRTVTPLNSPLEVGVRALVLLTESHPRPLDLAQLVALDYLVLHSGEFDGPRSLHPRPASPGRRARQETRTSRTGASRADPGRTGRPRQ
ncbi:ABC-three component system middle component 2 [Streptomyces anulatus]|uniref:ABC-three component system middle component 2 n=1 Tax=Streptomyces anulatus TaxID=1892 RepID=UPI00365E108B